MNRAQRRWRVWFTGEIRDVWAGSFESAIRTAEYAQRVTNAPKGSRRAQSCGPLNAIGGRWETEWSKPRPSKLAAVAA